MEAGVAVPDDWVGKRVALRLEGGSGALSGELTEVSDRGVVIDASFEREAHPHPLFFPWGAVRVIELDLEQAPE